MMRFTDLGTEGYNTQNLYLVIQYERVGGHFTLNKRVRHITSAYYNANAVAADMEFKDPGEIFFIKIVQGKEKR